MIKLLTWCSVLTLALANLYNFQNIFQSTTPLPERIPYFTPPLIRYEKTPPTQYVQPLLPTEPPTQQPSHIAILNSKSRIAPDGSSYEYSYDTENGISAQVVGNHIGTEADFVQGGYRYISPEGHSVSVYYIADAFGYRAFTKIEPFFQSIPDEYLRSARYKKSIPESEKSLGDEDELQEKILIK